MIQTHRGAPNRRVPSAPELRLVHDRSDPELVQQLESAVDALSISIVVPAFNEATRLPKLFRAITDTLDLDTIEVIVVDDGSSDSTVQVAEAFIATTPHGQVVRLGSNRGKGCAIREGVQRTSGDIVMFMDADAATDLACVEPLVRSLDEFDVAIGSRSHVDARVERAHRYRAYMGGVFNIATRKIAGLPYRDTQCGFKAFRGSIARLLFSVSTVDGFAFDVEVLRQAQRLGFSITEIPVAWTHQSGSKIRHLSDPTRMLLDVTRVRVRRSTQSVSGIRVPATESGELAEALEPVGLPLLVSARNGSTDLLIGHEPPHLQASIRNHLASRGIRFHEVVCDLATLSV